jgi:hypothetical protein
MWALPTSLRSTEDLQVTGLSCPDCHGVLQVAVVEPDSGFLQFVCRIGHAFSLSEVMAAKEAAIEAALRECEVACAEMIQLLDDIEREDVSAPVSAETRAERRASLERHLDLVRAVIERDRPLELDTGGAQDACDAAPDNA